MRDAAVDKITFQSPGQVRIQSTDALQARIPNWFTGTDSLTNQPLTLSPGNNVVDAVSFSLIPIGVGPGNTTPSAVCVVIEDVADRNTGDFSEIESREYCPTTNFLFYLKPILYLFYITKNRYLHQII